MAQYYAHCNTKTSYKNDSNTFDAKTRHYFYIIGRCHSQGESDVNYVKSLLLRFDHYFILPGCLRYACANRYGRGSV